MRWLLRDDKGKYVGRVAAFINKKTYQLDKYTVGQMGFFECIDNQEAAFKLFDQCRLWLEERGMEAMEGPVNFGERIEWWGLLVNGYNESPVYAMPYTHEYYVKFFEGEQIVVIHEKEHYTDCKADIVIYDQPGKVLSNLGYDF